MDTLTNNYDSLEQIIFKHNLRIKNIMFYREFDKIIILLNNGSFLTFKFTSFPALNKATEEQLLNNTLISGGLGIHFKELDEDYSLKGFLKLYLENNLLTLTDGPGNIQNAMAA
jgi:Protein of unknown function (DUF2442)